MLFSEIVRMALSSLGANKLRAALTMTGITIGVFSIISVMTAIGALENSIESGISFLGSNIFQFAKYPVNIDAGGETKKKYQNRRNITYRQALRYYELMQGNAWEICLKCFGRDLKGKPFYKGASRLQRRQDTTKSHRCRDESKLSHGQCFHARVWSQSDR